MHAWWVVCGMTNQRDLPDAGWPTPILPRFDEIDPSKVLVRYDDNTDTMHVHFSGRPQPAVIVAVTDCVNLRVNVELHQVVGLQIDDYLSYAIQQIPVLIGLAELAGIESSTVEAARQTIPVERKRESALRAILNDIKLAIT